MQLVDICSHDPSPSSPVRLAQSILCPLHSGPRLLPPSSLSTSTSNWGGLQDRQDFSYATWGTGKLWGDTISGLVSTRYFPPRVPDRTQGPTAVCVQIILHPPRGGDPRETIHFSTLVSSKSLQTPSCSSGRYFLLSAASLLHGLLYSVCQVFWDLALWNPQIIFLLTKSSSFKGRSGLTDLCNTLQAPVLKVESWTMSSLSQLIVCLPPEVMESLASMRETPRATRMRRKWK